MWRNQTCSISIVLDEAVEWALKCNQFCNAWWPNPHQVSMNWWRFITEIINWLCRECFRSLQVLGLNTWTVANRWLRSNLCRTLYSYRTTIMEAPRMWHVDFLRWLPPDTSLQLYCVKVEAMIPNCSCCCLKHLLVRVCNVTYSWWPSNKKWSLRCMSDRLCLAMFGIIVFYVGISTWDSEDAVRRCPPPRTDEAHSENSELGAGRCHSIQIQENEECCYWHSGLCRSRSCLPSLHTSHNLSYHKAVIGNRCSVLDARSYAREDKFTLQQMFLVPSIYDSIQTPYTVCML